MSKKVRTAILVAGAVASAAQAGAAPLPGFTLTAQTARFSFYSRGPKVDAGKVEATLTRLEGLLGHRLHGRAEYYRYASAQEIAAGTGHYAAGVTFPGVGQVHSTEAVHEHEIVHLVAGQMGDPGVAFQEGLAVALGDGGKWRGRRVDDLARKSGVSVDTLVRRFESLDPSVAYPAAGSFVAFLLESHGAEKVAAFFKACRPGTSRETAFARVFGQSITDAGAAWAASL